MGLKFYRQCPIFYEIYNQESFFIADFLCFEKKTVIEIDGKIHAIREDLTPWPPLLAGEGESCGVGK